MHAQASKQVSKQGAAPALPSWCVIRKHLSQAEVIKRCCFKNVLAEVSLDVDGSAAVRVHEPRLAAVTVSSVGTLDFECAVWPFISLVMPSVYGSGCLEWAAAQGPCSFFFRADLVSSCLAVCPLCWLPRRLVYARHVRTTLDSEKSSN
jgi:hypothetical protein